MKEIEILRQYLEETYGVCNYPQHTYTSESLGIKDPNIDRLLSLIEIIIYKQ